MAETVVREGMACEYNPDVDVTLTFEPLPGRPYRHTVTCSGCGEGWETNGKPGEFLTRVLAKAQHV